MSAVINPETLSKPKNTSHGIKATGAVVIVSGQYPYDKNEQIVGGGDFAKQFAQSLANVLNVVKEAGGTPQNLVKLSVYFSSKWAYLAQQDEVDKEMRSLLGEHRPPTTYLEIKGFTDDRAMVMVEAMAVV